MLLLCNFGCKENYGHELILKIDPRAEVAVHEALEDKEKKNSSGGSGNDDEDKADAEAAKEIFDLLKMVECCVAMMDGQFNGLDGFGRSRLSKNLLDLVLSQVK